MKPGICIRGIHEGDLLERIRCRVEAKQIHLGSSPAPQIKSIGRLQIHTHIDLEQPRLISLFNRSDPQHDPGTRAS